MRITNYMAAAAAMMLFVAGPAARAQTAGSTSGPAAGSPVAPNTAVQKENPANPADRPPMSGPGLMLVQGWSGRHG